MSWIHLCFTSVHTLNRTGNEVSVKENKMKNVRIIVVMVTFMACFQGFVHTARADSADGNMFRILVFKDINSLKIPLAGPFMTEFERKCLFDLKERKRELLQVLSVASGPPKAGGQISVRGLPLCGAIGVLVAKGESVKHLFGSTVKWLQFKCSCRSGQASARKCVKARNHCHYKTHRPWSHLRHRQKPCTRG